MNWRKAAHWLTIATMSIVGVFLLAKLIEDEFSMFSDGEERLARHEANRTWLEENYGVIWHDSVNLEVRTGMMESHVDTLHDSVRALPDGHRVVYFINATRYFTEYKGSRWLVEYRGLNRNSMVKIPKDLFKLGSINKGVRGHERDRENEN